MKEIDDTRFRYTQNHNGGFLYDSNQNAALSGGNLFEKFPFLLGINN